MSENAGGGAKNNKGKSNTKSGKIKKKLKGIKSESKIQTAKRSIFDDEQQHNQDSRFKKRLDAIQPEERDMVQSYYEQ